MTQETKITPAHGDALLIVDVQNDFLPGGSLAVPDGDWVVPILNRYIQIFEAPGLPIYASRDWHPADHCSFEDQGGIWPPHCIAGSTGARFSAELRLPKDTIVASKATTPDKEAYSAFEGSDLAERLCDKQIRRLFIGGLATDYCVLNTVKDALERNFAVFLLQDAIRAVNLQAGDGRNAEKEMRNLGAVPIDIAALVA